MAPSDYSVTAYDAALVILDAVRRVAASGKPIDRHAVRDAIQATNLTPRKATSGSTRTAISWITRSASSR